jgi:tetratricopeptide (TPR) repeat protein
MKKSLVILLLVFATAELVQQSAAQGATQTAPSSQKQIKDPAEYNSYVNAIQQSNPAQKASAIEAFLQTYPTSVMKEDAMEQLMAAYQQAGDAQKTIDTANRILQVDPNNVRALVLLAYSSRAAASQGGPQMQQNLDKAKEYGQKGLAAVQSMKKPDGMSDADFTKFHNETSAIFDGAVGFAALQAKDFATAQKDLREAVSEESQPSIADVYPLATADLEAKPMNPEGFWFVVKASQMVQGADNQKQLLEYGRKKYIRYHGKEDGWTDVVNQAKASQSIMPPAGFTVAAAPPPPSPAEQAADLVKSKDPKQMSFAEWELVLSSGNQQAADTVWNAIKEKAVKLGANVISATASKVTLAGSDDDIEAKKADIDLTMAKALPAKLVPQAGTLMTFQGTVASYTPNPFMMTMTEGVLLDKNGNPVSTTAVPAHHTAPAHKKPAQ